MHNTIFKLTHREQNLFSSLQNFKHIFCFTHILQFKMAHFKCTEHSSLHKTQQSDIKSHVCHFKTLPFKITLHELIGHYMCHLTNNCYCNCYHFNQEVSTKRPQVSFFFPTTIEDVAESGRGGGRVRMRGGGRVRGRAGRGGHGQRRQQLSNENRATLVDHIINHGLTLREAGLSVILQILV